MCRTIGGQPFEIVCDDEALLKTNPCVSAVSKYGHCMLYGNLFITGEHKNGNLTSLTNAQIEHLKKHIKGNLHKTGTVKLTPILVHCSY